MNVKYQIFVSSTYEDLRDERNEVIKACLNMGHIPVGMEMFNAADEEQWAVITRTIDQCDYYVVIVAHRYGSTVDRVSFTEKEYDYAVEQGVPVLGFVIDDGAPWPSKWIEKEAPAAETLQNFKSKVKQKMVRFWRDKSDLQAHFAMSLSTTIHVQPRRGWMRAPARGDTDVAQALSNLSDENARLRRMLEEKSRFSTDPAAEALDILVSEKLRDKTTNEEHGVDELFASMISYMELIHSRWVTARGVQSQVLNNFEERDVMLFLHRLINLGVLEDQTSHYALTDLGKRVYTRILKLQRS